MTPLKMPLSSMSLTGSIFLLSSLILLTALVVQKARQYFRLRNFKGPFSAGFTKFWMVRKQIAGRIHLDLWEANAKYGSLARIGPNELITDDLDSLRRIWGARSGWTRSDWYDVMRLDPNRDNVMSYRDDRRHNELRSKMAAGYSGKENDHLEDRIDEQIALLINLIDKVGVGKPGGFDFAKAAQYFTMDVISSVAFGKAFGFVTENKDMYEYIKTTEETLPFIIIVGILPSLNKILQMKWLNKLFMPSVKDKLGLGRIMGIAKEIVAERLEPDKLAQRDMLGSFLRHGLDRYEAESEVLTQIMAGSDTVATAMRATMLHIISSPLIYNTLIAEIALASQEQRISSPIQDAEAKKLPYLQACISEGLRIFPPVTGLAFKQAPDNGDILDGQQIPPGTKVGIDTFGLCRNPKIWGEESHIYRPERWLEAKKDEAKLKTMEAAMEFIFSWGKWQCLGKSVAQIELNKVFVELLRHFDFGIADPIKPWETYCVGLFIQRNMFLKISRREPTI